MDNQPRGNNTVLWIAIVVLLLIIVGVVVWLYATSTTIMPSPAPTAIGSPTTTSAALSEQPNLTTYNLYLSAAYLSKLAIGEQVGPNNSTKTTTFSASTDQLCTNLILKQDLASGQMATAIYDIAARTYSVPKAAIDRVAKTGGSTGCQTITQATGKYEYKIYINDILVSVLPFEIK